MRRLIIMHNINIIDNSRIVLFFVIICNYIVLYITKGQYYIFNWIYVIIVLIILFMYKNKIIIITNKGLFSLSQSQFYLWEDIESVNILKEDRLHLVWSYVIISSKKGQALSFDFELQRKKVYYVLSLLKYKNQNLLKDLKDKMKTKIIAFNTFLLYTGDIDKLVKIKKNQTKLLVAILLISLISTVLPMHLITSSIWWLMFIAIIALLFIIVIIYFIFDLKLKKYFAMNYVLVKNSL